MDGYFRLGMVNQHKHLLKPGDQCIGGGYSKMASAGNIKSAFYLSRHANRLFV